LYEIIPSRLRHGIGGCAEAGTVEIVFPRDADQRKKGIPPRIGQAAPTRYADAMSLI
jgi:hypothetical protein